MAHKLILALGLFLLAAAIKGDDDAMKELAAMLHGTCTAETGVSEDLIAKANKGEFTDDPKLKCYMKCIFVQSTGMEEDGTFNAESMVDMLPDSMKGHAAVIRACKDENGADSCDKAFNINKCFHKTDPKSYILI